MQVTTSRGRRAAATVLAVGATLAMAAPANAGVLDIYGQAQQKSNWCWAATGASIADWHGVNVSQNTFCNLAFGYNTSYACPNDQATLGNDQRAFRALRMNPGYYTGVISAGTVNNDIASGRPINTRIQWTSGGGHMMAIYGYDSSTGRLNYYNPWPNDARYNTATYNWYRSNYGFTWTHSLYGIGA